MTHEIVLWIALCMKMICGIAAMQLVETGVLQLDYAGLVE